MNELMDITNAAQLGVAGLMGGLWWFERRYSRTREEQLTQAHEQIRQQHERIDVLLDALNGNTKAIAEFTAVQNEILRLMKGREASG